MPPPEQPPANHQQPPTANEPPVTRSHNVYDTKNQKLSPLHTEHYYLSQSAYTPEQYADHLENLGYSKLSATQHDVTLKAYQKIGTKEIVFANRGTVPSLFAPKDIRTDYNIYGPGSFFEDARVKYDLATASRIMNENPGHTFSATGHSLGGTMAAQMGMMYNIPYTAFNPGAPTNNLRDHFINERKKYSEIHKQAEAVLSGQGTVYRYGNDSLSSKAATTYVGATYHNIKSKNWIKGDHSLHNFQGHLHDTTVDVAEGLVGDD